MSQPTLFPKSVDEILPTTTNAIVEGASYRYLIDHRGNRLCVVWGSPTLADAEEVIRLLTTEIGAPAHRALFDGSGLQQVNPEVLARMHSFMLAHCAELGRAVTHKAVVFSSNLAGTMLTGYYAVFPPTYELFLSSDRREALAWLGCSTLADLIEARSSEGPAADQVLGALRVLLGSTRPIPSLDEAARRLATSTRSLQRRLHSHGRRYADEAARARIAHAQRLILEGNLKLEAIALEVGCATPTVLGKLFRRLTGLTPTEWRAQNARAAS